MKRIVLSALLAVCAGVGGFIASTQFFMGIGYQLLAMLLGGGGPLLMSSPVVMICIHAAVGLVVAGVVFQVAMNRYPTALLKAAPVVYVVAAFALVMLKSRGVSGVNLNPLNIVDQFRFSPATVFFNLFVLVPAGALLRARGVAPARAAAGTALVVVACELAQWLLRLGICDVVDIALNLFGCAFGYCVADAAAAWGLVWEPVGGHFCRIARKGPRHMQ